MIHRIGFHSPEEMQRVLGNASNRYGWLTRKPGLSYESTFNNCVWAFTRTEVRADNGMYRYYMCSWFMINDCKKLPRPTTGGSKKQLFDTLIEGVFGQTFKPWIYVTDYKWFQDLYVYMNNFSKGFSELPDQAIISHMIELSGQGKQKHPLYDHTMKSRAKKGKK